MEVDLKMATKAQLARKLYKQGLSYLSPGQRAAVTRAYNAQNNDTPRAPKAPKATGAGIIKVSFGRPSVNGLKDCLIKDTETLDNALVQAGIEINKDKEGILAKSNGKVIIYTDTLVDGEIYMVVPGIDSSQ